MLTDRHSPDRMEHFRQMRFTARLSHYGCNLRSGGRPRRHGPRGPLKRISPQFSLLSIGLKMNRDNRVRTPADFC